MTSIHACLLGEWVNLCDDPESTVGNLGSSPIKWFEENAEIWSPFKRDEEHTMYQQDYVRICYKNASYRIHPMFIQVVTT